MTTTPRLPTGTVTFLFTDIEGSTALWGQAPHGMSEALAAHDALFRAVVAEHDGAIFKTVGDAICAAFARADDAIAAAIDAQHRLEAQTWPEATGALRVRMGIHTGQAIERDSDYFGPALNRVARIMSIAHGGQILMTRATASVVDGVLDPSIHLRDLGVHHLKGIAEPETAFQIVAPGLRVEFPPLSSGDHHPNNLPAQISSFVGRTRELAELAELVAYHRLVTIAGPGGIGKTRISLQLAAEVLDRFPDGAWVVELAPLNDPDLIAQTVGDAFHLREQPQSPIDDQLLEFFAAKKLLLVLDNSEHLLQATAELARRLLRRCPNLVIVTTSREPLHLTGEHVYRLPPLGFTQVDAAAEAPAESVELFLERAHAVRPGLSLRADELDVVTRICRKLEGIPLAIELAAARVVTLPLSDLERRLEERFELLASRDTTKDERHRTLYAAIDWSYQLLADAERSFLRAVAVFDGGFTLEAAVHVAAVADGAALGACESIVDKSLAAVAYDEASARYALADAVRDFLRRTLTPREAGELRNRHLAYFREYVKGADDRSLSGRERWLARLTAEIANVRAAIDWGFDERPADVAAMLAELSSYWWTRGYITEGESQLRRFLARPETPDEQRAPLLRLASTFATIRGDYEEAYELTTGARDAYQRINDGSGIAEALHNLGVIEHQTGNDTGATEHYGDAMLAFRSTGHKRGELICLLNLTLLALKADDFPTAEERLALAAPLADKIADAGLQSQQIGLRGTLAFRLGQYDRAADFYAKALAIKRRLGERFETGEVLDRIAKLALKRDDIETARSTSAECMRIALELDSHILVIRGFETFAELALIDGDVSEARRRFDYARALRVHYSYHHSIRDLDALDDEIASEPGGERTNDAGYDPAQWRAKAELLADLN